MRFFRGVFTQTLLGVLTMYIDFGRQVWIESLMRSAHKSPENTPFRIEVIDFFEIRMSCVSPFVANLRVCIHFEKNMLFIGTNIMAWLHRLYVTCGRSVFKDSYACLCWMRLNYTKELPHTLYYRLIALENVFVQHPNKKWCNRVIAYVG